ncbi:unnamed protein product [Cylicostephanus goldi]|uniref:Uncharacterized protein n=1 Tax=Cylicostephanus goldi TaxID=71465 RepID=A0A3P6RUZ7_CYLGO|nr:unnamed protein product [Cylicostephanus goldi]
MNVSYIEGSSPERPFLRPPNTTAKELMEIHRNYRRGLNQEVSEKKMFSVNTECPKKCAYCLIVNNSLIRRSFEDLQNLEHPDPSKRPRYLPLAPPYHLLPNTSFFRKASIKPPPTYSTHASILVCKYKSVDQMRLEEELKLHQFRYKRSSFTGLNKSGLY